MAANESVNTDAQSSNASIVLDNSIIKSKVLSGEFRINDKRARSKVWTVFGKIENLSGEQIPNVVACRNCLNIYKFSNNSTSNLVKHKCFIETTTEKTTSKIDTDSETKKNLLSVITEWTIENCRPFGIVNDSGFKKVAEYLISIGAKYGRNVNIENLLPHPTTVSRNVTKVHNTHFQKVKTEITSIKSNGFGLTSDLWKDDYLKKTYLALTIQYIKEGHLISRLLGMKSMDNEKCTSEKVNKKVSKILEEFDLELDDKSTIVTDRGSNMVAGFRDNNHIYCVDHLLHNTMQKSMKEVSEVSELSNLCTKLVKYFKVSGHNSTLNTTLKSFSVTRWNTLYYLFVSIERNWTDIVQILQQHNELNRIHNINLSHITAIIKVLEPFQEAFKKLEGENYATIHLVYMMVDHLKKKCVSSDNDLDIIKQLKEKLSSYLDSIVLNNLKNHHKIAVFLFPPANKLYKFSYEEKIEIIEECKKIMSTYLPETLAHEEHNQVEIHNVINEYYSEYVEQPQNLNTVDQIASEISSYQKITVSNFNNEFDILQWWDQHKTEYPFLYKLSCKILATPASSAASERVFSIARNLISEKRCSIAGNDKSVNEIMFLHSNIKKNELQDELLKCSN